MYKQDHPIKVQDKRGMNDLFDWFDNGFWRPLLDLHNGIFRQSIHRHNKKILIPARICDQS